MEAEGYTAVLVSVNGSVRAVCALVDALSPHAARTIAHLEGACGVREVWMVTGDARGTALGVAERVGIPPTRVLAACLPGDKVRAVEALRARGLRCAFVGDGINDAPALAAADVGIAIGAGAQVALAAADIVLLRSCVTDVAFCLELSRAVLARIKLNFAWALGYNALAIPLAAGVLFPAIRVSVAPEAAGFAMALSSVSVVLSSLQLKYFRRGLKGREGGRPGGGGEEAGEEGEGGSLLTPAALDAAAAAVAAAAAAGAAAGRAAPHKPLQRAAAPLANLLDLSGLKSPCSCTCTDCGKNSIEKNEGLREAFAIQMTLLEAAPAAGAGVGVEGGERETLIREGQAPAANVAQLFDIIQQLPKEESMCSCCRQLQTSVQQAMLVSQEQAS